MIGEYALPTPPVPVPRFAGQARSAGIRVPLAACCYSAKCVPAAALPADV